jgi:hypothetical protein
MGGQYHARPLYHRVFPGTHCTGGWVGPRAGLDVCEKRDSKGGMYKLHYQTLCHTFNVIAFNLSFKDEVQTDLFKYPVRNAQ